MFTMYQSRESRTKKKGSLRFRMTLCVYILAVPDSLLVKIFQLFRNEEKQEKNLNIFLYISVVVEVPVV